MKTVSPYLSAEALGLKEDHRQALIGLAGDLAHHRIPDDEWGMQSWCTCICGHLKKRIGVVDYRGEFGGAIMISGLFFTGYYATQEQAGQAVFNYLTLGAPHWEEIKASFEPEQWLV
jgi:hypothetical protein